MDARYSLLIVLAIACGTPNFAVAQKYRADSENFIIYAPDARLAKQASQLAEKYRKELSIDWLGYEISTWCEKCPVYIKIGPHAGGETSFAFVQGQSDKGEPISWQMKIYGPPDRLLDAVLPHEVTHTIFATHFGRPLPRWADEGACTTVEHESERAKNHRMLISFLTANPSRGIPFNRMFTMKQYPHDILPLYAQGYSVAKYLIAKRGRQHFVKFLEYGMSNERAANDTRSWDAATEKFFGYQDLSELQLSWIGWVRNGSQPEPELQVASNNGSSSSIVDPSGTYAIAKTEIAKMEIAKTGNSQSNPIADEIDRGVVSERKLNSWYARQSRAKTAVDSSGNLSRQNSGVVTEFRPGSLKRSNLADSPFAELFRRKKRPSDETIWR